MLIRLCFENSHLKAIHRVWHSEMAIKESDLVYVTLCQ